MSNNHAAIMFADVSGSSKLFKTVGDVEARNILAQVVQMMSNETAAHQGTVIKTIGDEVMASFPSAEAAANAAISIQQDIHEKDYGCPLSIRIGMHFGSVIEENNDVYGEAVNDAAALVKEAKGGQVIISDVTLNALSQKLKNACHYFDDLRLKGGDVVTPIHLLHWEDEGDEEIATRFVSAVTAEMLEARNGVEQLSLIYAGKLIELHKSDVPFSIGRGRGSDLTIKYKAASREHCTIDYRRGKFVLIDKSTNGTHVKPSDRESMYLRREESPLVKSGTISFALDGSMDDGVHLLHYIIAE